MAGGKSTQQQAQTFTDNRAVLGEGSNYANNGASISNYVLDNGAVGKALDFAAGAGSTALSTVGDTFAKALTFAGNSQGEALDFGTQALKLVGTQTAAALDNLQATQKLTADAYNDAKGRGAMTDKLLIAAIAAMGLIAFAAVRGGKL